jgi:ribosome-binding protein aMBF1 (putative translation factor)
MDINTGNKLNVPRAGSIKKQSQDEPLDFGASLRLFRQAQGISQSRLGEEINYSQRIISDVERGNITPSQAFKDAIAAFKKLR